MTTTPNKALPADYDVSYKDPESYSASFSAQAVSAAIDLFELVANVRSLDLTCIELGQVTDYGDAEAEGLGVQIIRGFTVASNGTLITPAKLNSRMASTTIARVLGATVANSGQSSILFSGTWNIQAGFFWKGKIKLLPGERLVVRQTVPDDSITMSGSIKWCER